MAKSHAKGSEMVLAVCDEELLGKVFEDGSIVLDLKRYKAFYDGKKVSEEELLALASLATSINAVGSGALVLAKRGICDEKNIRYIKGVPHIQIYKL
ncbi:MAG: DUF424 family protein [Candidatus Anstonellales archaeon]